MNNGFSKLSLSVLLLIRVIIHPCSLFYNTDNFLTLILSEDNY